MSNVGWWIKVGCGCLLLILVFEYYLFSTEAHSGPLQLTLARALVITGGACSIYHFLLLRAGNKAPGTARKLITEGGLYRYIRHPMYLGDSILYAGLCLLAPSVLTISLTLIGWGALYFQAGAEDEAMARQFGPTFEQWYAQTGLLLPRR